MGSNVEWRMNLLGRCPKLFSNRNIEVEGGQESDRGK
jgi:hypothetical protein